jgi:hypothetical protein
MYVRVYVCVRVDMVGLVVYLLYGSAAYPLLVQLLLNLTLFDVSKLSLTSRPKLATSPRNHASEE